MRRTAGDGGCSKAKASALGAVLTGLLVLVMVAVYLWAAPVTTPQLTPINPQLFNKVFQGGGTGTSLASSVLSYYGSIVDTLRHLVGADASYLHVMSGGAVDLVDEETLDLDAMREVMAGHANAWQTLITDGRDPATIIVRHRDDGSETRAPLGVRLAQALHHGTDHRSQVCTALTALGITPPEIDAWDMALVQGRLTETEPTSSD